MNLEHIGNLETWTQTIWITLETLKPKHNRRNLNKNYLEHIGNLNMKLKTW
jgi:hypothetical protein